MLLYRWNANNGHCFRTGVLEEIRSKYVGWLGQEYVQDSKCEMPLSSQKLSISYPQTETLAWRVGFWECGADFRSPELGIPRKFKACQWLTCLEFFHLNLPSFLTNEVKFIFSLKEALKRLYFLLIEIRVIVFTSSSKTTAQTCGAARDGCGIHKVLEFHSAP